LDATPSSRAPFEVPLTEAAAPKRRSVAVALLLCAASAVAVAAAFTTGFGGAKVPLNVARAVAKSAPAAIAAAASPPPAPIAPGATTAIPSVDVAKLPRAKEGTVIGAEGHRLWIDGTLQAAWQSVVKCGSHVVQVGSAGTPRTVDVPCGEAITVSP
jgi:hypothetical protein